MARPKPHSNQYPNLYSNTYPKRNQYPKPSPDPNSITYTLSQALTLTL